MSRAIIDATRTLLGMTARTLLVAALSDFFACSAW